MRTVVREKLRKYLLEHGRDVLKEPESLRLYLLREEGRFSQEIDGLLRLIEEGFLPPFPRKEERESWLRKIADEIGVSSEDALWLLESWEETRHILEPFEGAPEEAETDTLPAEKEAPGVPAFPGLAGGLAMFLTDPRKFVSSSPPSMFSEVESFLRHHSSERPPEAGVSEDMEPKEEKPELPEAEDSSELHENLEAVLSVPEEEPPSVSERKEGAEQPLREGLGELLLETSLKEPEKEPFSEEFRNTLEFQGDSESRESSLLSGEPSSGYLSEEDALFRVASSGEEARFREGAFEPEEETVPDTAVPESLPESHIEERPFFPEPELEPKTEREDRNLEYIGSRESEMLFNDTLKRKRLFRLALAGVCGIVAAGFVGYTMWRNTPERLLERGRKLLEQEHYTEAAEVLRKALHKTPEEPEGYRLLGEALYQQGDYQGSLKALEETLRRVSADAFLFNSLAYSQLSLGDSEEAASSFQKALEMVPLYPQARKGLALAHLQQGQTERAAEELQEALNSLPEDGEMLLALGEISLQKGNLDKAETLFARVLDLEPDNESARLEMEELARQKSLRQAREAAKAARLSEYLDTGERLLVSGDVTLAEDMYRKALEEAPNSPEARVGLLDAYLIQHRSEEARHLLDEAEQMEQAGELPGDFVRYLRQTLTSYEKAAQERKARHEQYDMAIARASEMRERGKLEGALAAYRGILEEEEYPPAYVGLARTLAKQGKYEEALKAYERGEILLGASLEPSSELSREMEDLRLSLAKQELAKELEPLYRKARTLERQGNREEARKLYESILQRDPSYGNARKRLDRLAHINEAQERGTSVSQPLKPAKEEKESSSEAPPEWLLLPNGEPARLEMERQQERIDHRGSSAGESRKDLSLPSPAERMEIEMPQGESSPFLRVERLFLEADILARQGNYGKAEALYRKALESAPLRGDLRHNLAWVLGMQGNFRGALKEFRQALLQIGPNGATLYNLAYLYSREENAERAFRTLEQALAAPKRAEEARLFLFPPLRFPEDFRIPSKGSLREEPEIPKEGYDVIEMQDFSAFLENASKLNPEKASLYEAFETVARRLDTIRSSEERRLRKGLGISSAKARGFFLMGHALYSRGKYERAKDFFKNSLAADPGRGISYVLLACNAKALGDTETFRKALLLGRMHGV